MKSPQGSLSPTISTKFPEMFVLRSIDKFSCRISTLGIILVVESPVCDTNTYYLKAIRAGAEVLGFPTLLLTFPGRLNA